MWLGNHFVVVKSHFTQIRNLYFIGLEFVLILHPSEIVRRPTYYSYGMSKLYRQFEFIGRRLLF